MILVPTVLMEALGAGHEFSARHPPELRLVLDGPEVRVYTGTPASAPDPLNFSYMQYARSKLFR